MTRIFSEAGTIGKKLANPCIIPFAFIPVDFFKPSKLEEIDESVNKEMEASEIIYSDEIRCRECSETKFDSLLLFLSSTFVLE